MFIIIIGMQFGAYVYFTDKAGCEGVANTAKQAKQFDSAIAASSYASRLGFQTSIAKV